MLRVLHLSDLHFGEMKPGVSAHRFADASGKPLPHTLADILLREVAEAPHVVIVSGDVGWAGKGTEYAYAHQFFDRLRTRWKDVPLVVAPGNHDVDYDEHATKQAAFTAFVRKVQASHFGEQYLLLDKDPDSRRLLVAFQQIRGAEPGEEMLIVAVNSAAYIEDKDAKGTPVGFTAAELQAIADQLRDKGFDKIPLKLFVLHHALFPFAEPPWANAIDPGIINEKPDQTIVANSATLQGWLAEHSFQVVLHGHKHAMHGRQDTLWRKNDRPAGRRLFVLGAGSTGVEQGHLAHNESLSFNLLEITRLSRNRWLIDVAVYEVLDPPERPRQATFFHVQVGEPIEDAPLVFQAEDMVDCHRAIRRRCPEGKILRNFVSVVENFEFRIPPTARFKGEEITKERIKGTFLALHPEHDHEKEPPEGWKDRNKVDSALRTISPRLQFQHGPRLFGRPQGMTKSPIEQAVGQLKKDLGSDAYASLFRPEVDVNPTKVDLMPHLMSIQFIREGDFLDAVVTFRKIELSYWWVANMYEVGKILEWAAKYGRDHGAEKRSKPRRITFFSPLVEWKNEPEAAFVTQLDRMTLEELTALVADVYRGAAAKQQKLVELLKEKLEHTNENNLDAKGLDELRAVFTGLASLNIQGVPLQGVVEELKKAIGHIHAATEVGNTAAKAEDARTALAGAIRLLSGSPGVH